jgi:hypothetical protein
MKCALVDVFKSAGDRSQTYRDILGLSLSFSYIGLTFKPKILELEFFIGT